MKPEREIDMRQVREAYARLGASTRELASRLLGDPFQAERVARKALFELHGEGARVLDWEEQLREWIAERVESLCLQETGNVEVADWDEYQAKHPDEDEEGEPRASDGAHKTLTRRLRAVAGGAATRKAREKVAARGKSCVLDKCGAACSSSTMVSPATRSSSVGGHRSRNAGETAPSPLPSRQIVQERP
jgi:DNA-directed RNA polymerase specialized sigma24 family protein